MQGDSIDDAEMVCLTTNFCYDALLRESAGILFKYFLSAATLIFTESGNHGQFTQLSATGGGRELKRLAMRC